MSENPYENAGLVAAISTYREIDEEIKALEAQLKEARGVIEALVKPYGGAVHLRGLARVVTVEPSTTWSYDKKEVDAVKDRAARDGDMHTVHALAAAMKETKRGGGIRITIESI